MFLPDTYKSQQEAENIKKAEQKEAYHRIEKWALDIIPDNLRGHVLLSVQEVECNEVACPIDTAIAIIFSKGGRGMLGLPMEAKNVTLQMLIESFPTEDVLTKWSNGEEAEWPPFDDMDDEEYDDLEDFDLPSLRFAVGTRVECRIGPDPVEGWAKGEIIKHWYREDGWPEDSYAPYRVQLDNGQGIFAPGDVDQVIRAEIQ